MIIGIVTAIMVLFTVLGSEYAFIDSNAKKHVKKYIVDKNTRDEVLGLMKAYSEPNTVNKTIMAVTIPIIMI